MCPDDMPLRRWPLRTRFVRNASPIREAALRARFGSRLASPSGHERQVLFCTARHRAPAWQFHALAVRVRVQARTLTARCVSRLVISIRSRSNRPGENFPLRTHARRQLEQRHAPRQISRLHRNGVLIEASGSGNARLFRGRNPAEQAFGARLAQRRIVTKDV